MGKKQVPVDDLESFPESPSKKGPHPINTVALRRLKIIEGQIRGIQRMIEQEKYCVDILRQVSAVRSALNNVGKLVLRRHIDNCVTDAIRSGGANSKDIIDELMDIFAHQEI